MILTIDATSRSPLREVVSAHTSVHMSVWMYVCLDVCMYVCMYVCFCSSSLRESFHLLASFCLDWSGNLSIHVRQSSGTTQPFSGSFYQWKGLMHQMSRYGSLFLNSISASAQVARCATKYVCMQCMLVCVGVCTCVCVCVCVSMLVCVCVFVCVCVCS